MNSFLSIEFLFGEKGKHMIGNFMVIKVAECEVRIAVDANIRQREKRCITSVPVDRLNPNVRSDQRVSSSEL